MTLHGKKTEMLQSISTNISIMFIFIFLLFFFLIIPMSTEYAFIKWASGQAVTEILKYIHPW